MPYFVVHGSCVNASLTYFARVVGIYLAKLLVSILTFSSFQSLQLGAYYPVRFGIDFGTY